MRSSAGCWAEVGPKGRMAMADGRGARPNRHRPGRRSESGSTVTGPVPMLHRLDDAHLDGSILRWVQAIDAVRVRGIGVCDGGDPAVSPWDPTRGPVRHPQFLGGPRLRADSCRSVNTRGRRDRRIRPDQRGRGEPWHGSPSAARTAGPRTRCPTRRSSWRVPRLNTTRGKSWRSGMPQRPCPCP